MLDKVELLERLTAMWKAGTLTEAEFQQQKEELLAGLGRLTAGTAGSENRLGRFGGIGRNPKVVGLTAVMVAAAGAMGFALLSGTSATGESNTSTSSVAGAATAGGQSVDDAECGQFDAVSHEVAGGQLYAYFSMYSPIESSTFSKLSQNGGLSVTGFPKVSGTCNAAFRIQGIVDGTSYDVRLVCPITASTPSDTSGKMAASKIDIQNCRE